MAMNRALLALVFCATSAAAGGLQTYSRFVVTDGSDTTLARDAVRVTYLGVNGYQFEADGHALLVDPYFTRASLTSIALNRPLSTNAARIEAGLRQLAPRVDAILVTHAHFDHLLDVPQIVQRMGAPLLSGPTAIRIAQSAGVPSDACAKLEAGTRRMIGPWRIRALPAQHDRLFGSVPFAAPVQSSGPPRKPSDWKVGEPLAFLIEANGRKIFIDSGGTLDQLPPATTGPVDLAILGVALPDSRKRIPAALARLQPRFFLPSHQDDFFAPFDRGFSFGKLTNFPEIAQLAERHQINTHLILLDYFRPWTIP
jgi:L-ascorbate metabolism protein UlaG (beta-lactamase superfamily)